MKTNRYCPECRCQLREMRDAAGSVNAGEVACKNLHVWRWDVRETSETLSRIIGEYECPTCGPSEICRKPLTSGKVVCSMCGAPTRNFSTALCRGTVLCRSCERPSWSSSENDY